MQKKQNPQWILLVIGLMLPIGQSAGLHQRCCGVRGFPCAIASFAPAIDPCQPQGVFHKGAAVARAALQASKVATRIRAIATVTFLSFHRLETSCLNVRSGYCRFVLPVIRHGAPTSIGYIGGITGYWLAISGRPCRRQSNMLIFLFLAISEMPAREHLSQRYKRP